MEFQIEKPGDLPETFGQLLGLELEAVKAVAESENDKLYWGFMRKEKNPLDILQERVDRFHAEQFADFFPRLVLLALANQIKREREPIGSCEEPGARAHYARALAGKIEVFRIGSQFVGRSNDDNLPPPRWVDYAAAILRERGWEVEVKSFNHAEVGVGNHAICNLYLKDPRSQEEIDAAIKAMPC